MSADDPRADDLRAEQTERIGILGGTFDPIHVAHLAVAVAAQHALGLDRVLLVVSNVPWQKAGSRRISDAADRLAMVRAAVEGHPGLEASSIEIDRGGDSYTADTLRELSRPGRELFLIVGADLVDELTSWRRWEEIPALCTLAVAVRGGETDGADAAPAPFRRVTVPMPMLEISASELRTMRSEGRPIDFLVTDATLRVINDSGLYPSDRYGGGRP